MKPKGSQQFPAWVCALLFVFGSVIALFLFNIERGIFSAETYKQAFEKQGLYARTPAILAEVIHTYIARDRNSDPYLKALTVPNWEASVANLLPPDELTLISNNALDSVFAYLNNEADSASISLILLKRHIAGPQGVEVVLKILDAQPDCTLEQLMQMGLGVLSSDFELCKPSEEFMGLVTPLIETQLQAVTRSIPDEVALISNEKSNTPDDPRIRLNIVRAIMKWSPVFTLIFLVGMTFFAVRSLRDWLQWWGYSFLITGVSSAFLAWIGSPILRLTLQGILLKQATGFLPLVLVQALGETVGAVAGQTLLPVIAQGVIIGAIGLGMVVTSLFIRQR